MARARSATISEWAGARFSIGGGVGGGLGAGLLGIETGPGALVTGAAGAAGGSTVGKGGAGKLADLLGID